MDYNIKHVKERLPILIRHTKKYNKEDWFAHAFRFFVRNLHVLFREYSVDYFKRRRKQRAKQLHS